MRNTRAGAVLIVLLSLLLLVVGYAGLYIALSEPAPSVARRPDGYLELRYHEHIGGGGYVEPLFWPLSQIDRQLRPERWRGARDISRP